METSSRPGSDALGVWCPWAWQIRERKIPWAIQPLASSSGGWLLGAPAHQKYTNKSACEANVVKSIFFPSKKDASLKANSSSHVFRLTLQHTCMSKWLESVCVMSICESWAWCFQRDMLIEKDAPMIGASFVSAPRSCGRDRRARICASSDHQEEQTSTCNITCLLDECVTHVHIDEVHRLSDKRIQAPHCWILRREVIQGSSSRNLQQTCSLVCFLKWSLSIKDHLETEVSSNYRIGKSVSVSTVTEIMTESRFTLSSSYTASKLSWPHWSPSRITVTNILTIRSMVQAHLPSKKFKWCIFPFKNSIQQRHSDIDAGQMLDSIQSNGDSNWACELNKYSNGGANWMKLPQEKIQRIPSFVGHQSLAVTVSACYTTSHLSSLLERSLTSLLATSSETNSNVKGHHSMFSQCLAPSPLSLFTNANAHVTTSHLQLDRHWPSSALLSTSQSLSPSSSTNITFSSADFWNENCEKRVSLCVAFSFSLCNSSALKARRPGRSLSSTSSSVSGIHSWGRGPLPAYICRQTVSLNHKCFAWFLFSSRLGLIPQLRNVRNDPCTHRHSAWCLD